MKFNQELVDRLSTFAELARKDELFFLQSTLLDAVFEIHRAHAHLEAAETKVTLLSLTNPISDEIIDRHRIKDTWWD